MDSKNLTDARDYLSSWLERSRQAADAATTVQQLYDLLDWEVRTYQRRPAEANSISTADLDRHAQSAYARITSALPMIPAIPMSSLTQVSSVTAST